jgi:hypothetical protein
LLDAIAALPFSGGLAPLASADLIKTVQFTASAGLSPGRLLQRLEGLVDKVHRHSPHLKIFGPLYEPYNAGILYRERERLGKLGNHPTTPDTLADKTARMSRYITLLERLMALVPDLKPQDVLDAVQEATKRELQRAYTAAVAAHANTSTPEKSSNINFHPTSEVQSKSHPRGCSNRSSTISDITETSPALSKELSEQNLGRQIEQVLKSELPLSVEMVGLVARMVLVAWTLSVGTVAWKEGEKGFALDLEAMEGWKKTIMS